jgi:hypothetical protein
MKYTEKIMQLIKHSRDKGRIYDIILLTWSVNNYVIYNRNDIVE